MRKLGAGIQCDLAKHVFRIWDLFGAQVCEFALPLGWMLEYLCFIVSLLIKD